MATYRKRYSTGIVSDAEKKAADKRGAFSWQVQVRMRGNASASKTFDTKAEAERWAKEIETEMAKGRYVSTKEAESYTMKECLDRFCQEYLPRLKGAQREINRANRLARRYPIAQKIMATIRKKDLAAFILEREAEGVSDGTVRLDLAIISKMFVVAKEKWGMESLVNPVGKGMRPPESLGRERRLEPGEEEKLLEAADDDLVPVIKWALATCMRRSEICGLQWKDVNIERRTALLINRRVKNATTRTVPLSKGAMEILKDIPRNIGGSIFGLTPDCVTHKMGRAAARAGSEDLWFHDLRHEGTSRLFELTDLDTMEIKEITGHKTLKMLSRYTHLRANRLVERLDGARRGETRGGF